MNSLQRYIAANCATYDNDGKCLLDYTCAYFRETACRCSYAENAVIPGNAKLHSEYWAARGAKMNGDYCERCKSPYERTSNRQKYCTTCSQEVRKRKQRQYMQENRANS